MIEPNDFIYVDSWEAVANEVGAIYGSPFDVAKIFEYEKQSGEGPRTLITACGDAGLYKQAGAHPNADILKHLQATDWKEYSKQKENYVCIKMGPYAAPSCNPAHTYSMKTERYTHCTFDGVPENISRWFTVNLNTRLERTALIPFGLNAKHERGSQILPNYIGRPKTKYIYANFQSHSMERVALKNFIKKLKKEGGGNLVTFRDEPTLSIDDYLGELSEHRYCLCPEGNGLDCYRIWECLYLGVTPILKESYFSMELLKLGFDILLVPDWSHVRMSHGWDWGDVGARAAWQEKDEGPLKLSWWRDKIQNSMR